jgi:hypothetical protein
MTSDLNEDFYLSMLSENDSLMYVNLIVRVFPCCSEVLLSDNRYDFDSLPVYSGGVCEILCLGIIWSPFSFTR